MDYDLLTVYYLAADGKIQEMSGVKYDVAAKKMTFTTNHFSIFFVSEWISPFSDISKGDWFYRNAYAEDAMKWANANGLITGRTVTTLVPKGTATRAETAAILQRFIEGLVKA